MPLKQVKRNSNDKKWITDHFLELVRSRQSALRNNKMEEYKRLRNIVIAKSKKLKRKYYEENTSKLKNPKKVFQEIKNLTGAKKTVQLARNGKRFVRW
jgi:hypothetical protein